jgi:hypothetical protein
MPAFVREHAIPTEGERIMLTGPLVGRFLKKVKQLQVLEDEEAGPCWVWIPPAQAKGYGRFYLGRDEEGQQHYKGAHVIAYMHWVGPVPYGWIVDHLCNNKACCNPNHLEAIPGLENLRRAHERRPWKRLNQYEADYTDTEPDWRLTYARDQT